MALIKNFNVAINASTYVSINVPDGIKRLKAFIHYTADESGFYISHDGGTTETYIPSGTTGVNFDKSLVIDDGTVEIVSVKGTTSTNIGGMIQ